MNGGLSGESNLLWEQLLHVLSLHEIPEEVPVRVAVSPYATVAARCHWVEC